MGATDLKTILIHSGKQIVINKDGLRTIEVIDHNTKTGKSEDNKKTTNTLNVLHQNVRSLFNCVNQIEVEIDKINPLAFGVSEHWLSEDQIKVLKLSSYDLISATCRDEGHHGGVGI